MTPTMKPYLFQLPDWLPLAGGRPIFSYGVMLGISFIVGWSMVVHLCRRDGMDGRVASQTMLVIVISSLIGARALHFVSSPTAQLTLANFFKFDEGGLVAYGGIIAALAASWGWTQYKGGDGWVFWDNAAAPVALGLGITRVGCFLFGCDYGIRNDSMWAIRFPRWDDPEVVQWISRSAPAYTDHTGGVPDAAAAFSDHVHPTQLYESLVGFAAFGLLLLWRERKRFHGQIMLGFLLYYGVLRYLLETIRGDADRGEAVMMAMSTSQLIGVLLIAVVGYLWWRRQGLGLYVARGTVAWGTPRGYAPPGSGAPEPVDGGGPKRKKRKKKG